MSGSGVSAIIEAWNGRTARERLMLGGLGAVLAALLFWYGAYAPLTRLAQSAEDRRLAATQELVQVKAYAAASRPRAAAGDAGALSQAARTLAGETGVTLLREEAQAGALAVWTEPVQAKALFAWLARLSAGGVGVRQFEAHQGEGGQIDARVVLVGAGA